MGKERLYEHTAGEDGWPDRPKGDEAANEPLRWICHGAKMAPSGKRIFMPNLSIKDVPEGLAEALRQRAMRNHRSLQGELMAIIQQAVEAGAVSAPKPNPQSFEGRRGKRTIEDFAQESSVLFPEPVRGGPLAVDIVRAERDSR
jgi:plasmid stability protein